MGDESVHPLMVVRVDHHAGPLVQEYQVLVLIHNVQLGFEYRQKGIFPIGGFKKLVVDV